MEVWYGKIKVVFKRKFLYEFCRSHQEGCPFSRGQIVILFTGSGKQPLRLMILRWQHEEKCCYFLGQRDCAGIQRGKISTPLPGFAG